MVNKKHALFPNDGLKNALGRLPFPPPTFNRGPRSRLNSPFPFGDARCAAICADGKILPKNVLSAKFPRNASNDLSVNGARFSSRRAKWSVAEERIADVHGEEVNADG